jgi:hypothetical protein
MADTVTEHPARNEPCHCGSGKKYKHCCLAKDEEAERAERAEQASATPASTPSADVAPSRPSPPRSTDQPWKRGPQSFRGRRRMNTPRKAG